MQSYKRGRFGYNLHSTMYLLNRKVKEKVDAVIENLHSTMYLLNPGACTRPEF